MNVKLILERDEKSRNSDIRLTQMFWWTFHNSLLFKNEKGKLSVEVADLEKLPREDHLSRVRRKIQEDAFEKVDKGLLEYKKYLPTSLAVIKQRKMNEVKWLTFGINKI